MLKYSKNQNITLNLNLILSDGTSEDEAIISYGIFNPNNELLTSGTLEYNSELNSYNKVIEPWDNQIEGNYYIKYEISNTSEEFAHTVTEELYIESYDEKLSKILGLVHENIFINDPTYDDYGNMIGATLRIYSDSASVGTTSNIIGTYKITANPIGPGRFSYWKQEEIT